MSRLVHSDKREPHEAQRSSPLSHGIARELRKQQAILEREIAELEHACKPAMHEVADGRVGGRSGLYGDLMPGAGPADLASSGQ
jgi:hypothetical protein